MHTHIFITRLNDSILPWPALMLEMCLRIKEQGENTYSHQYFHFIFFLLSFKIYKVNILHFIRIVDLWFQINKKKKKIVIKWVSEWSKRFDTPHRRINTKWTVANLCGKHWFTVKFKHILHIECRQMRVRSFQRHICVMCTFIWWKKNEDM